MAITANIHCKSCNRIATTTIEEESDIRNITYCPFCSSHAIKLNIINEAHEE